MTSTMNGRAHGMVLGLGLAVMAAAACGGPRQEPASSTEASKGALSSEAAPPAADARENPHRFHGAGASGHPPNGNFFGRPSFYPCQPSHLVLHGGQPMMGP